MTEIQAGDRIGKFEVVEVADDYWGVDSAVFLMPIDGPIPEGTREWVIKEN